MKHYIVCISTGVIADFVRCQGMLELIFCSVGIQNVAVPERCIVTCLRIMRLQPCLMLLSCRSYQSPMRSRAKAFDPWPNKDCAINISQVQIENRFPRAGK
jgi:hypothetical protein